MADPLSPEGYAAAGGYLCPACGAGVDKIAMEIDFDCHTNRTMIQGAECLACGAAWDAVYEVTGYAGLTLPQPDEENDNGE